MTTYSETKKGGDFLAHRESVQSNMFSAKVKAPASGGPHNVPQVAGMPVLYVEATRIATLLLAADEATANGFLVEGPPITAAANGAETPEHYSVVMGENVTVNEDIIPADDPAGTAYTLADIKGGAAVSGFRFVDEPEKKSTQTT